MSKKKNKKTPMQKALKKIRKFFVNGKPMSQVVHWTVILSISGLIAIKVVEADHEIQKIFDETSKLL